MSRFSSQVTYYKLNINLLIHTGEMFGKCQMKICNVGKIPLKEITLLLNKGLRAISIIDNSGRNLDFQQSLREFHDYKNFKVNYVVTKLRKMLKPRKLFNLSIDFQGCLKGYEEVFPYTKDRVSEKYSLIRTDVFAYPILGDLNWKSLVKTIVGQSFDYQLKVTVSRDYVVASGGRLVGETRFNDKAVYEFKSLTPTWRIDIAAAKFKIIKDEKGSIKFYVFKEDSVYAEKLLKEVEKAFNFYQESFGDLPRVEGYTVIEIPQGWGGQAGVDYMLLDSSAFRQRRGILAIYHELAHLWYINSGEKFVSRFFDEGFASYFQALAEERFLGHDAFLKGMERARQKFIELCNKDKRFFNTPMNRFGEFKLTDASYFKGAWALYVLHKVMGTEKFMKLMRSFLQKYREKPATIKDFQKCASEIYGRNLKKFFDEWFYGVKSSVYLSNGLSIDEIVAKYR